MHCGGGGNTTYLEHISLTQIPSRHSNNFIHYAKDMSQEKRRGTRLKGASSMQNKRSRRDSTRRSKREQKEQQGTEQIKKYSSDGAGERKAENKRINRRSKIIP